MKEIKQDVKYEATTSEEYAKTYGYESWNDFENNADYHTEKTLMDMKIWFFEGSSAADIINVLEGQIQTDYNNFTYLKDLDRWIYKY